MELPQAEPFDPSTLTLKCVICSAEVPERRARGRSKDTCSPECHAKLRKFRKWVLVSSRCPSCYHPSTPAERKEFLLWRKHRGDRQENRGRPAITRHERVKLALVRAIELLRAAQNHIVIADAGPSIFAAEIRTQVEEFEKLIDIGDIKQSTLATSG